MFKLVKHFELLKNVCIQSNGYLNNCMGFFFFFFFFKLNILNTKIVFSMNSNWFLGVTFPTQIIIGNHNNNLNI